jgi:hypothetical protein
MRTFEEIKEYLMIFGRFSKETEEKIINKALLVEKIYAKEIENGDFEYALLSDFINSPFILEDEDEVEKLVKIDQIGSIVVYKPIFTDDNEEIWECSIILSLKNSGGIYDEINEPFIIYGNTKDEVITKINNVIYTLLELNQITTGQELCVNYSITVNDEYNDSEEFFIQPNIEYDFEPSKLINWGEHTKGLPIIYSINREKSNLNILEG